MSYVEDNYYPLFLCMFFYLSIVQMYTSLASYRAPLHNGAGLLKPSILIDLYLHLYIPCIQVDVMQYLRYEIYRCRKYRCKCRYTLLRRIFESIFLMSCSPYIHVNVQCNLCTFLSVIYVNTVDTSRSGSSSVACRVVREKRLWKIC